MKTKTIAKKRVFQGYFAVDEWIIEAEKFNGTWSTPMKREIFERGHAVGVIPYDPKTKQVVLIEQFRPGALAVGLQNPWLIEIVAGIIEPGESPETVAHRELFEETGLRTKHLQEMAYYLVSPGGSSETLRLYLAHVDAPENESFMGLHHENEDIRVFSLGLEKIPALLKQNQSPLNLTLLVALQWLLVNVK